MYLRKLANGHWRAEYRDAAGRKHSKVFDRQVDAKRWAAELERDVRRGRHVDPRAGRQTFGPYLESWWESRVTEASTRATDRGRIDKHLLPHWRTVPLDAIAPSSVQGWVAKLLQAKPAGAGLAPATVHSCHQLLVSCLEAAVLDHLIADNPARHAQLPTVPPGREVYLTRDEVDLLLEQLAGNPRTHLAVHFLAYTGLRFGELAGLTVDRLDLLRRRVDVVQTIVEVPPRQRLLKHYTKGKARRSVPLPLALVDELAVYLAEQPVGRGEPLFPGLSRHTFARWHGFRDALTAAQLPRVRVHDLRHSYASWLVQDGVTLPEVAAVLGHASINTTMRYSHLAPDTHDRVLGALDQPASASGRLATVTALRS